MFKYKWFTPCIKLFKAQTHNRNCIESWRFHVAYFIFHMTRFILRNPTNTPTCLTPSHMEHHSSLWTPFRLKKIEALHCLPPHNKCALSFSGSSLEIYVGTQYHYAHVQKFFVIREKSTNIPVIYHRDFRRTWDKKEENRVNCVKKCTHKIFHPLNGLETIWNFSSFALRNSFFFGASEHKDLFLRFLRLCAGACP